MKVKPSAEAVFALTSSNTGDNGTFKNVTGVEEHVDAGYGKSDDIVKDKGIQANQRQKEAVSEEQKVQPLYDTESRVNSIFDKYNSEKYKLAVDPHFKENQAMNSQRGNLNKLTFDSTLNLSRAADALNNKRWLRPGRAGLFTKKYGVDRGDVGGSERWEPITTQEMRQMRQDEDIESAVRRRDINRQANVLDYSQELRRKADDSIYTIANLLGTSDVNINNAIRNGVVGLNINTLSATQLGLVTSEVVSDIAMRAKNRSLQAVAENMQKNPDAVSKFASIFLTGVATPGQRDIANTEFQNLIYQACGGDPYIMAATKSIVGATVGELELQYNLFGNRGR